MGFEINVIPDWPNLVLQLLATLVLFIVIKWKFFAPVKAMLDKRNKYIEENISQSESNKDEIETLKNEYDAHLQEAKAEARQIVADARKRGDEIIAQASEEAKVEVKRIYDKNEKSMELERKKAFRDLQEEVVDIALLAAEQVAKVSMDNQKNKELIEQIVKQAGESTWKN